MILDLFAGPRGWSEGLRLLGLTDVGIEWDGDACATAAAAGHPTIRADVAAYPVEPFVGRVSGLIASPPCQAFSKAGKRGAAKDARRLRDHAIACHRGWIEPEWVPELADPRAGLVLQPLRWADALRPEWIVLEQVPEVLPLWQSIAVALEGWGYSVWTGVLLAADYGVPQKRRRAILIASRTRRVGCPRPTHAETPSSTRQRYVSMGEALGWTLDGLVGFPRLADSDETVTIDGTDYRARDLFPTTGPAQTVTEKARSWRLIPGTYATKDYGHRRPHGMDEPAPTMAFGNDGYRVTVAEAGILQSFPADYPWQGSQSAQFLQVGNAVPPLLAAHVIAEAVGLPGPAMLHA